MIHNFENSIIVTFNNQVLILSKCNYRTFSCLLCFWNLHPGDVFNYRVYSLEVPIIDLLKFWIIYVFLKWRVHMYTSKHLFLFKQNNSSIQHINNNKSIIDIFKTWKQQSLKSRNMAMNELLGTGSGRLGSGQEGTLEGFGGVTSK